MQAFQYYLRNPAAKDSSMTHAAAVPSNLDAASTMRSAETELQNTIELHSMTTPDDNNHAAIPTGSATRDSRNA